jgi:hypothetical protein
MNPDEEKKGEEAGSPLHIAEPPKSAADAQSNPNAESSAESSTESPNEYKVGLNPDPSSLKPVDKSAGSEQRAPGQSSTEGSQMPTQPRERRSRWESSFVALRYLSTIGLDSKVKMRDSDRATSLTLLIAATATLISIFVPVMTDMRFNLLGISDLLGGLCIIFYLANRFGILSTLPPRAAILSWQLIIGAWFLGIYVTINVVLIGFLNQHRTPIPETQPIHIEMPSAPNVQAIPPAPDN